MHKGQEGHMGLQCRFPHLPAGLCFSFPVQLCSSPVSRLPSCPGQMGRDIELLFCPRGL